MKPRVGFEAERGKSEPDGAVSTVLWQCWDVEKVTWPVGLKSSTMVSRLERCPLLGMGLVYSSFNVEVKQRSEAQIPRLGVLSLSSSLWFGLKVHFS